MHYLAIKGIFITVKLELQTLACSEECTALGETDIPGTIKKNACCALHM